MGPGPSALESILAGGVRCGWPTGSEEEGAVEGYPRLQRLQKILDVLDRTITEAERQGDPEVRVFIARGAGEAKVELSYFRQEDLTDRRVNLAEALGLGGGETVSLFGLAESAGYIRPNYGMGGPGAQASMAVLDHLETSGYELIGELPNPGERLMLSLEAAEAAIDARQDLGPEQKEVARRALEELKHFLRGLPPGVAVEVGSTFFRGMFGG